MKRYVICNFITFILLWTTFCILFYLVNDITWSYINSINLNYLVKIECNLWLHDGQLSTRLYDKRDDLYNFNYKFSKPLSDIPIACCLYSDCLKRNYILNTNLLNHRLIFSFQTFFGSYQYLVGQYFVLCVEMTKYCIGN